ncbi:MAG: hypothetical protein WD397_02135 [Wenzhouxiangellaceae bacterium]
MLIKKLFFMSLALSALAGSGCASVTQDILEEHQCMREASNRADAHQRKAECQQRMEGAYRSQTPDS